jgi:hypothetical protein
LIIVCFKGLIYFYFWFFKGHCSSFTKCNGPAYVGPQCECVCPDGLSGTHCEQVKIAKSGKTIGLFSFLACKICVGQ